MLWALTPDGRPHNLGEVVPGTSDKARLRVTTDMQAFAMIVTAEPHSAVRQPSDVVVLENQVRPDTVGKIEQVDAKYELMPRGLYSWQVPDNLKSGADNAPRVSMREYEALSELYQAQNALGMRTRRERGSIRPQHSRKSAAVVRAGAESRGHQSGPEPRGQKPRAKLRRRRKTPRVIAEKHQQDEKIAKAQADATRAQPASAQAEAGVQ